MSAAILETEAKTGLLKIIDHKTGQEVSISAIPDRELIELTFQAHVGLLHSIDIMQSHSGNRVHTIPLFMETSVGNVLVELRRREEA